MKQFILKQKRQIATVACVAGCLLSLSFQDTPFVKAILDNSPLQDTTPVKKKKPSMTMKEFDNLTEDLDKNMTAALKDMNFAMIENEKRESLKVVDIEKMMKDVEKSLKDIYVQKIVMDANTELNNIYFNLINEETRQSLAEGKMEIEKASTEIKKIDKNAIRKEMEQAKLEVEKSRAEISKINMNKIRKEAETGLDKVKAELKQTRQMFHEMEQDGLVNSKQGFHIEYKDKVLYIDGIMQTAQVTAKYRHYFKDGHFGVTIDKE